MRSESSLKACGAVCLGYLALFFMADLYYADDLFRLPQGYWGWVNDGRPLASLFYELLLLRPSALLPDIYPVPLLVAAALFCLVFDRMVRRFCPDSTLSPLLLFVFLANPFFISNLLFKYDGAFMLLAAGAAMLPFAWPVDDGPRWRWWLSATLALVAVFSLYQAAVNVFIGLTGAAIFADYLARRRLLDAASTLLRLLAVFIAAYLIYRQLILPNLLLHGYFSNFNQTISLDLQGWQTLQRNVSTLRRMLGLIWASGLALPATLLGAVLATRLAWRAWQTRDPWLPLVFLLGLGIATFASAGIVLLGANAAFYPRVMIGTGTMLLYPVLALLLLGDPQRPGKRFFIPSLLLCLALAVIAAASLNASKQYYRAADILSQQINSVLRREYFDDVQEIMIFGKPAPPASVSISTTVFPVVGILLPQIFDSAYDGGRFTLTKNGLRLLRAAPERERARIAQQLEHSPALFRDPDFDIFLIDGVAVIVFL